MVVEAGGGGEKVEAASAAAAAAGVSKHARSYLVGHAVTKPRLDETLSEEEGEGNEPRDGVTKGAEGRGEGEKTEGRRGREEGVKTGDQVLVREASVNVAPWSPTTTRTTCSS